MIDRPTFSHLCATQLDKTLQDVMEFAGAVTSFGDADGFFNIEVIPGTCWSQDLDEAWEHMPPEYYEFVSPQGYIYPVEYVFDKLNEDNSKKMALSKKMREDDKKNGTETWSDAVRKNDVRLIDGYDDNNLMHWIITAKAGLVCNDSKYDVRTGFWTRIVSPSFELAFQRTKELWEEEHKRESHEKDWPLVKDDYNAYVITQARDEESIKRLVKDLEEIGYPEEERFSLKYLVDPRKFTTKQYWKIFDLLEDLKRDVKIVEDKLGNKLKDQRFIDYRKAEEDYDQKRDKELKSHGNCIPWEEVEKGMSKRTKLFSEFLKSIGEDPEEDE